MVSNPRKVKLFPKTHSLVADKPEIIAIGTEIAADITVHDGRPEASTQNTTRNTS